MLAMEKVLATNKKASFSYHIIERVESGIVLVGSEVKSCRNKQVSLGEGYVTIDKNNAFLVNVHIAEYSKAFYTNHNPLRKRRLLLHKKEIKKCRLAISQKGMTLVPLKMYLKLGLIKLELGLAQGKSLIDKRIKIKDKEEKIKINRLLKNKPK